MVAGRAGAGGDIDSDGEVEEAVEEAVDDDGNGDDKQTAAAATITITNTRKEKRRRDELAQPCSRPQGWRTLASLSFFFFLFFSIF